MSPTWLVERLKCIATAYAVSMNNSGMLTKSSIAWSFRPKRWRSIAFPLIACKDGRVGENLSCSKVSDTITTGLSKQPPLPSPHTQKNPKYLYIYKVRILDIAFSESVLFVKAVKLNIPVEPTLHFLPVCFLWFKVWSCSYGINQKQCQWKQANLLFDFFPSQGALKWLVKEEKAFRQQPREWALCNSTNGHITVPEIKLFRSYLFFNITLIYCMKPQWRLHGGHLPYLCIPCGPG